MILQALMQYYESLLRQDMVPDQGWCQAKVSHAIELNMDGTIKEIFFLKQEKVLGKRKIWEPQQLRVPEMVSRSSGVSANFLCDNAKYLLGIDQDGVNAGSRERFEAAREKHLEVLKQSNGVMAKAICQYFANWNPETALKNSKVKEHFDELNEGGNVVFSMGALYAQEDEEIQQAWECYRQQEISDSTGICLVTGKETEIVRTHRGIRGVPGAQSSGAALVSFNAPAFESYGKEQSYNAPVGKYAEFAYTTALNYLIERREYRFPFGDSMVVFWSESGEETYQKSFLEWLNPSVDNQDEMKKVFGNLQRGLNVDLDDINLDPDQKFYILCLAPNAARLSVRFFYCNSFGNILKNIAEHYKRMEIVKPSWETNAYLGIERTLNETVNQKSRDKTPIPNMAAMMLKAILEDSRYPASLYTDTLIRIRVEQGKITYGRAAILKAFLIKNCNLEKGDDFMGLNEECKEKAYIMGRLFAVLESIQKDASPEINSTIRDRYFNSACTTPASVFPILIKLKNSHIKKLEREKRGRKKDYEKKLTELIGKVEIGDGNGGFPRRFSLEEQGKFMLGYYHQMQKMYEKREDK